MPKITEKTNISTKTKYQVYRYSAFIFVSLLFFAVLNILTVQIPYGSDINKEHSLVQIFFRTNLAVIPIMLFLAIGLAKYVTFTYVKIEERTQKYIDKAHAQVVYYTLLPLAVFAPLFYSVTTVGYNLEIIIYALIYGYIIALVALLFVGIMTLLLGEFSFPYVKYIESICVVYPVLSAIYLLAWYVQSSQLLIMVLFLILFVLANVLVRRVGKKMEK